MIAAVEVTAHAADARRGVTLIDIDLAPVPFKPFCTLAVEAITLIKAHTAIQARGILAFVIVSVAVDAGPPIDTLAEVCVVPIRVGVAAFRTVPTRFYAVTADEQMSRQSVHAAGRTDRKLGRQAHKQPANWLARQTQTDSFQDARANLRIVSHGSWSTPSPDSNPIAPYSMVNMTITTIELPTKRIALS